MLYMQWRQAWFMMLLPEKMSSNLIIHNKKSKTMNNNQNVLAEAGAALGIGLIAGLAGTAAMTLSKKLDKKMDERKSEKEILDLSDKVLDLKPTSDEKRDKVIEEIHWAYGASCGVTRGLLSFIGLRGLGASAAHFAALWYWEKMCMPDVKKLYPDVEGVKPINEEKPEIIGRESIHIAIYALVTGFVFDAIMPKK